ncbi:MAG: hypothetical protein ACYDAZ_04600 [Thermoplasmataceae archaeon]
METDGTSYFVGNFVDVIFHSGFHRELPVPEIADETSINNFMRVRRAEKATASGTGTQSRLHLLTQERGGRKGYSHLPKGFIIDSAEKH